MQLNIETGRLTHTGGDITDIRHLRTKVEMQQLQTIETPGFTQRFHQLQNLRCRQAKFGFFAAGGLPFARPLRSQTRTHAQTRNDVQTFGFIQHNGDFRHLLDDQIDFMAHLLANQRQANVLTVFIAVTHNYRTGHPGMRQDRHQFRFGTGFQTQRFARMD